MIYFKLPNQMQHCLQTYQFVAESECFYFQLRSRSVLSIGNHLEAKNEQENSDRLSVQFLHNAKFTMQRNAIKYLEEQL